MSKKKADQDVILAQIKKAMGLNKDDETVTFADQYVAVKDVIPTGMSELDHILTPMIFDKTGVGGIPRGFVCEFYGPHAGGKSSLCHKLAAHVTQNDGLVLWMDAEGSFVNEWSQQMGVDTKKVIYVSGTTTGMTCGEAFLEKLETIVRQGLVQLAVIDSVTALQPKEVMETALAKEARIGAGAKMLTRALPKIITAAKVGNCSVVFINQIRQKIGVMYGNPETTPYGEALKFYSSLRLRLSQVGSKKERGIMKEGEEIGIRTNVRIEKSRFGPPFKEAIMPIYYSDTKPHPIDIIIDAALSTRIVKSRSRAQENGEMVQTFTFGELKIQGIGEFKNELMSNPLLIKEMARQITEAKIAFDPEVVEYVKSLDTDALAASA